MRLIAITLFIVLGLSSSYALAAVRVALVIGNSGYAHVPRLTNPENDAKAIGEALGRLGFEVTNKTDLDQSGLIRALRDFAKLSRNAEMAMIYYAGHGIEVDKQNFLIPTDARLASDDDIEFETVSLDRMNLAVAGASELSLVMIDACRDNPFANQMSRRKGTRSIGRGLARVDPTQGTLVSFAAQEGTTAEDGDGKHSPYASALLENLETPGIEVSFLFRKVRDTVMAATGNRQQPFTYGSLPGREIYLKQRPAEQPKPVAAPAPVVTPEPAKPDNNALELAFWNAVKDTDNPELLSEYLDKFESGTFRSLARLRLEAIDQARAKQDTPPDAVAECNRLAEHPDQTDRVTAGVAAQIAGLALLAASDACRSALAQNPDDPKLTFQLGRIVFDSNNRTGAAQLFQKAADQGYAPARKQLVLMGSNGRAEKTDPPAQSATLAPAEFGAKPVPESLRVYKLAADQGLAWAQFSLGLRFEIGDGVKQDKAEAARLWKLAADQGNEAAQRNLGFLYETGEGVKKNSAEAARLYKLAADQGYMDAQYSLARMYHGGIGVKKDLAEATRLYGLAAGQGDAVAKKTLSALCKQKKYPACR